MVSALPPGLSMSVSDAGNLLLRQDVGDTVAFGGVLEDQFEAEFLGEADGGHEVVSAVAVEVDGSLVLQDFHERFEREVAVRGRRPFLSRHGLLQLLLILAGLEECFPLECGDFHAREGRLLAVLAVALGVFAIGHLETAENF